MAIPNGLAILSRVQTHDEAAFWVVAALTTIAVDRPDMTVPELVRLLRKALPKAADDYISHLKAQNPGLVGRSMPAAPSFGTGFC